jgi:hypothetical protein
LKTPLQCGDGLLEPADRRRRHLAEDPGLDPADGLQDTTRDAPPRRRQGDPDGTPVCAIERPRDQPAPLEPVDDARERRPPVSEAAVEIGHRATPGRRQMGQDVRLGLAEPQPSELTFELSAHQMRRPLQRRNQTDAVHGSGIHLT